MLASVSTCEHMLSSEMLLGFSFGYAPCDLILISLSGSQRYTEIFLSSGMLRGFSFGYAPCDLILINLSSSQRYTEIFLSSEMLCVFLFGSKVLHMIKFRLIFQALRGTVYVFSLVSKTLHVI